MDLTVIQLWSAVAVHEPSPCTTTEAAPPAFSNVLAYVVIVTAAKEHIVAHIAATTISISRFICTPHNTRSCSFFAVQEPYRFRHAFGLGLFPRREQFKEQPLKQNPCRFRRDYTRCQTPTRRREIFAPINTDTSIFVTGLAALILMVVETINQKQLPILVIKSHSRLPVRNHVHDCSSLSCPCCFPLRKVGRRLAQCCGLAVWTKKMVLKKENLSSCLSRGRSDCLCRNTKRGRCAMRIPLRSVVCVKFTTFLETTALQRCSPRSGQVRRPGYDLSV